MKITTKLIALCLVATFASSCNEELAKASKPNAPSTEQLLKADKEAAEARRNRPKLDAER